MKKIRIFGIVLLVAVLAFAVAAFACKDQKATLDAAKEALDKAEKDVTDIVKVGILLGLGDQLSKDPNGEELDPTKRKPREGNPGMDLAHACLLRFLTDGNDVRAIPVWTLPSMNFKS